MEESNGDKRSSRSLQLPPGMSRSALCVNTGEASSPMVSTPSPSRNYYSDRFIPSRSASNLTGFALLEKAGSTATPAGVAEDASGAYSTLLRRELFGVEAVGSLSPATPDKMGRDSKNCCPISPNRNIFKFMSGAGSSSRPESPYSLSPVGSDGDLCGVVSSPQRRPEKLPGRLIRSWMLLPFKMIFISTLWIGHLIMY